MQANRTSSLGELDSQRLLAETGSSSDMPEMEHAMVGMMMMQMYFYMGTKVVYVFKE
jgi:hypothetical protein